MNYRKLKNAAEILGLAERATLKQIKQRHRELVKKHHPDHAEEADPERIRQVNAAYEVLAAYCDSYRYCFSEEEFLEQVPEERMRRQFSGDPVWGGGEE
jgi:DnaJ-class molecular chaperone